MLRAVDAAGEVAPHAVRRRRRSDVEAAQARARAGRRASAPRSTLPLDLLEASARAELVLLAAGLQRPAALTLAGTTQK